MAIPLEQMDPEQMVILHRALLAFPLHRLIDHLVGWLWPALGTCRLWEHYSGPGVDISRWWAPQRQRNIGMKRR